MKATQRVPVMRFPRSPTMLAYPKGKLVSAEASTYGPNHSKTIKEAYIYGGVGGRVSQRDTYIGGTKYFTLDATWHETGRLASLTYPDCVTGAPCANPVDPGEPARTVTYDYDRDFLTGVPGYASSITYHPNGMVSEINHTNGVQDLWTADPFGMARPAGIKAVLSS